MTITENSQSATWGSFVLVSYVPGPLGSFLDALRHTLSAFASEQDSSSSQDDIPQAHITILPRRPLSLPVELASQRALDVMSSFDAFSVQLSTLRCFSETNVLYLDIGEGRPGLNHLHDALNAGDLAHMEEFAFRPHLTVCCPVATDAVSSLRTRAIAAWESAVVPRGFVLDEIVCLWLRPGPPSNQWRRLWSHNLRTRLTVLAPLVAAAATTRTF